jgi:hypothetical protein
MKANKLRFLASYEEKRTREDDCNWLMNSIMAITMLFDKTRNGYILMLDTIAGFVNCRQQRDQTVTSYIEALKSFTDTIEYPGGSMSSSSTLTWFLRGPATGLSYPKPRENRLGMTARLPLPPFEGPIARGSEASKPH